MSNQQVVSTTPDEYGNSFCNDLIEQYKLTRSTITDLQNDRNSNNRFLFGISTALFSIEGFFLNQSITENLNENKVILSIILMLIPILGICISNLWVKWSISYGIALKVRYHLLKDMELHLPGQPFAIESVLRSDFGYIPISDLTIKMARFFMGGFILMLILALGRHCF